MFAGFVLLIYYILDYVFAMVVLMHYVLCECPMFAGALVMYNILCERLVFPGVVLIYYICLIYYVFVYALYIMCLLEL